MMKQCSSKQRSSMFASATDDELSVSQILLELENLFMVSELGTEFVWGRKKRRSSLVEASSYSPERPTSQTASVLQSNEKEVKVRTPQVKAEEECPAAKTSSPTTPLSFLPSESDEKSKHSSKKRSSEKYNNTIEELVECGDSLRGELEKVRNYYNELRTYNSELKALKLQVLKKTCPKKAGSQMETTGFANLVVDPTQHYQITMLTHQQPFIADPTVQKFRQSFGPITVPQIGSFYNGLEPVVNQVGTARIPDLNLSPEEAFGVDASQPLDVDRALADKRARFAEARRMRKGMIKIKSMRSACGIKLPRIRF